MSDRSSKSSWQTSLSWLGWWHRMALPLPADTNDRYRFSCRLLVAHLSCIASRKRMDSRRLQIECKTGSYFPFRFWWWQRRRRNWVLGLTPCHCKVEVVSGGHCLFLAHALYRLNGRGIKSTESQMLTRNSVAYRSNWGPPPKFISIVFEMDFSCVFWQSSHF